MQAVPRQAGGHAQLQLSVRGRLQQPAIVELQRPRLHQNARTSYATSQETGKNNYVHNYVSSRIFGKTPLIYKAESSEI